MTYHEVRKNTAISAVNLHKVIHNQKEAERKIALAGKLSAMHPKDLKMKAKIDDAQRVYEVITRQRHDAENQKIKIEHERELAHQKSRQLSLTTATAKANAERAYNRFVTWGNKFCQTCSTGVKKIAEKK